MLWKPNYAGAAVLRNTRIIIKIIYTRPLRTCGQVARLLLDLKRAEDKWQQSYTALQRGVGKKQPRATGSSNV